MTWKHNNCTFCQHPNWTALIEPNHKNQKQVLNVVVLDIHPEKHQQTAKSRSPLTVPTHRSLGLSHADLQLWKEETSRNPLYHRAIRESWICGFWGSWRIDHKILQYHFSYSLNCTWEDLKHKITAGSDGTAPKSSQLFWEKGRASHNFPCFRIMTNKTLVRSLVCLAEAALLLGEFKPRSPRKLAKYSSRELAKHRISSIYFGSSQHCPWFGGFGWY